MMHFEIIFSLTFLLFDTFSFVLQARFYQQNLHYYVTSNMESLYRLGTDRSIKRSKNPGIVGFSIFRKFDSIFRRWGGFFI